MKIKQEDFDRLNQWDRIEYRQASEQIEKEYPSNFFWMSLITTIVITCFFFGFLIIIKELNVETFLMLAKTSKIMVIYFSVWIFLSLTGDLIHSCKRRKCFEELDSKYFKHELKNRK